MSMRGNSVAACSGKRFDGLSIADVDACRLDATAGRGAHFGCDRVEALDVARRKQQVGAGFGQSLRDRAADAARAARHDREPGRREDRERIRVSEAEEHQPASS
jgi:hypothetical protein